MGLASVLLQLAAASLAIAGPVNVVPRQDMAGMAGMSMSAPAAPAAPAAQAVSAAPAGPAPARTPSDKHSYSNLQVPLSDPTKGYFEKDLDPNNPAPNTMAKTVKYGPYTVPKMGMIDGKWAFNVETPCNGCYVTAIQADLVDEDGRSANIDRGAWLHHMVIYNGMGFTPGSKQDLVCSGTLLSAFMGWPHRIFASGNERVPIRLNTQYKYGLSIDDHDYFHILYDLVNLSKHDQKYYIQVVSKCRLRPSISAANH